MIPGKWRRRIGSILIPFIIWNTVSVILELAKGGNVMDGGVLDFVVKNYLFIRGTGCANGPLWYLFRLMEYIVIAPLVFFIAKNKWLAAGAEIVLLAANYQLGIGYFDFSYWLPVYIVGAYVGINMPGVAEDVLAGKSIRNQKSRVAGIVIGIIIIIGFSYAVYALLEPCKSIVRYCSVVGVLLLVRSIRCIKPPHIVIGGGMWLYCTHDIVYRVIRTILNKFDFNMLVSWSLLIVASFALIILSYIFMNRYCKKGLMVLTGGR